MPIDVSFESAWRQLDEPFRVCLGQAWQSLCARGLPVGAVLVRDGEVVAAGRNRVYDPPGGDDRLQGTPVAHAEMNALAALLDDVDPTECELWTTQAPCGMCRAAVAFTEIPVVRYLATDPTADDDQGGFVSSGRVDDIWTVVANTLFLHNIVSVGSEGNPVIARNEVAEPEVTSLSMELFATRTFIGQAEAGRGIFDALAVSWESFATATARRRARLGAAPPADLSRAGSRAEPGVRFLYVPARDVEAMRSFYSDLVGLHETDHSTVEGAVAYDCAGLQFTIFEDRNAEPGVPAWATQPGWKGGSEARISWSVELSQKGFQTAVDRLRSSEGVERLHETPRWIGYWSFPVKDPMGNTVELSHPQAEAPGSMSWPGSAMTDHLESD